MLRKLNEAQNKTTVPWSHQGHSNQEGYHTSDIPWTQSLLC